MNVFRRYLARFLCPEVFTQAEAYTQMKIRMDEGYWWLAHEFPNEARALRWALDANYNRNRAIDAPAIGDYPSDISAFRQRLQELRRQTDDGAIQPNPDADIQRLMTAVSNMLFGDMEREFRELEEAASPFIDMHTGEPFVGWWKPDAEIAA